MQGTLARGGFVRLAYRLGRDAATGGLVLDEGGVRHELFLRRGYLTFARVVGLDVPLGQILIAAGVVDEAAVARSLAGAKGLAGQALRAAGAVSEGVLDAALRRQAELRLARLAAIACAAWRFDAHAPAPPAGRSGRPVALTAWARRHLEAAVDARALRAELAGARLVLNKDLAPDAAECDDADRRILAALAAPRRGGPVGLCPAGGAAERSPRFDEIARSAGVPELRLLRLIAFLRGVGALTVPSAAHEVLGVAADADAATVKQAYRRAARRLHPDMHPGAAGERRRALETEFASLTSAYRALTRSLP